MPSNQERQSDLETALVQLITNSTKNRDIRVERSGEKIILPRGMEYNEAIVWLKKKREEEESEVGIHEIITAFPWDGVVALMSVLKKRFGWTNLVPTPGFWGPSPPTMMSVEVGPNKNQQVPWGSFEIPNIEGRLETQFGSKEGVPVFQLGGMVKRKHEHLIHDIAEETRQEVKKNSIYRGKAIYMDFRVDGKVPKQFNLDFVPKFLETKNIDRNQLILSQETHDQIQHCLFNPIEHTQSCLEAGIPLKRGVLLEGPFGTGKTLTAHIVSKLCVDNGWTYLYLKDVRDFPLAIKFALLYQPTVIFAEDVDRIVGSQERNEEIDKVLNTIDGVDSKQNEIITILTTNDVKSLNKAFIRPGRIDAIVSINHPDEAAIVRLLRKYGGSLIQATDEELLGVVGPLVGYNAAVMEEVVKKAKLAAISHFKEDGKLKITAQDIEIAAHTMRNHLSLLKEKAAEPDAMATTVNNLMAPVNNRITEAAEEMMDQLTELREKMGY